MTPLQADDRPIDAPCPHCLIVKRLAPAMIVEETEHTVSWLHPEPATAGHSLVVPRPHVEDLYAIDDEQLIHTMRGAQRLALRLRDRLGTDGVNLINACRPAAWQTVFHFHVHVVPRYFGDSVQLPWTPTLADESTMKSVFEALREPRQFHA